MLEMVRTWEFCCFENDNQEMDDFLMNKIDLSTKINSLMIFFQSRCLFGENLWRFLQLSGWWSCKLALNEKYDWAVGLIFLELKKSEFFFF